MNGGDDLIVLGENAEIDEEQMFTDCVVERITGNPPLPERVGNWKRMESISIYPFARFALCDGEEEKSEFELVLGYFDSNELFVYIEENDSSLCFAHGLEEKMSEKELCKFMIDFMKEYQTPEAVRDYIEGEESEVKVQKLDGIS